MRPRLATFLMFVVNGAFAHTLYLIHWWLASGLAICLLNLTAVAGFRSGPFQETGRGASMLGYRVEHLDHPGLAVELQARFRDATYQQAGSVPRPVITIWPPAARASATGKVRASG